MERADAGAVCVVGLGNPGRRYAETRHNTGFAVVDALAERLGTPPEEFRGDQYRWRGGHKERIVFLCKPWTYMNLSGAAVRTLMRETGLEPSNMLVVCDEAAFPLGKLRLRGQGSSGGHNGMRSVIEAVGSGNFPRLRCGIGAPEGDYAEYVLSRFTREEESAAREMVRRAADAAICWIDEGLERAMNIYNAGSAADPGTNTEADAVRPQAYKE